MWTNEVLKSQKTKMSVTYDNKIYIDSTFVCIYVHIYTEREETETETETETEYTR